MNDVSLREETPRPRTTRPKTAGRDGVAVLVPCFNEEAAIGKVVRDVRRALPEATVYVYDNNSTDDTIRVARAAGAIVRTERRRGKGNVVRRMFADIDADAYVLLDGDATYDTASAPAMISKLVAERLDMVVGCRVHAAGDAYRPGHRFGNAMLTRVVGWLFGKSFGDILSGYRVFSRRFVKSFPALAKGFETETELTVHALELRMPVAEVETLYGARPVGSMSKLSTYKDGLRILRLILALYKHERPFQFFGVIAGVLALISLTLAIPILLEYVRTGLVPRLPTAVLSTGVMILASLSLTAGIILETVTRGRQELKRLAYLQIPFDLSR
jgi:glycosyltransferase involved in cell wall biosynthesis